MQKRLLCLLSCLTALFAAIDLPAQGIAAKIETSLLRFTVFSDGTCELYDKQAQVAWRGDKSGGALGHVTLVTDGKPRRIDLTGGQYENQENSLLATFHPLSDQPGAVLQVRVRPLPNGKTLDISYRADDLLKVQSTTLLENLLRVTDSAKGYVIIPVREGLLIPADSGIGFEHRFDTFAYEGCHMQMLGAVQNGAAALVTWSDPYVTADVKSVTNRLDSACWQQVTPSLALSKSATSFQIHLLGKGDYVTVAKAYREVAKTRGYLVTWDQKLKTNPMRAKLFGAANIKLWSTLDRRMNEESTKEESSRVNWTFDEAARVAEHFKRDLKLDKVLFTIGGWIHRGYDNQHPDILPTAPECGGDAAFSDCSRRVMNLGYLFCLHDNYQDIYRDSPSWDEKFIMKTPDGKLTKGGHWAGGLAYLTCSQMALELGKRPQNLTAVKKLCDANSYFIDTTYAAGLQECFDPAHPLTRGDDMKWKQALSDYARQVFGVFGSECGREWAIPHSDFFEGLTGVSGAYYHNAALPAQLGATVIPLFELVYRDGIAMYGKYGYDPYRATDYVLQHISIGRPLNYHSIPAHLYWQHASPQDKVLSLRPAVAEFKQTAPREFQISYRWTVQKPPTNEWKVFVHFTDRSGAIKFQNDYSPSVPITQWSAGENRQGPFAVTVPEGLAGTFNVRMGLFDPKSQQRALLQGRDNGERSYSVGRLTLTADKIDFQPVDTSGSPFVLPIFTQCENGWAEGLHPMDCFIKNTCEILSPLNELTARMQMTSHEFLTPDRMVRKTVFGTGKNSVDVIVNGGAYRYVCRSPIGGEVILPPSGFLVDSPTFVAFHALSWAGTKYSEPVMFTLRSLDDRPLSSSRKIRIYHAFGPEQIHIANASHSIGTEAVVH
jgi:hypothetical protein